MFVPVDHERCQRLKGQHLCLPTAAGFESDPGLGKEPWRAGRAAVMSGLLARDHMCGTVPARQRWEAMARANIVRELDSLTVGSA